MSKNMKNAIDARLDSVKISSALREEILLRNAARERVVTGRDDKKKTLRTSFVVALAACFCILLSVPVLEMTFPGFNAFLAQISPEMAQHPKPVEFSAMDNGIKIDVVGAMQDKERVIVYLTVQDLTGDRLSKDMIFEDFEISGINQESIEMAYYKMIQYDEATKTLTMRVVLSDPDFRSGKITLKINALLSIEKEWEISDSGINLGAIAFSENTLPLDIRENIYATYSDPSLFKSYQAKGFVDILKPDEMNIPIRGEDNVFISNMGFVDGYFHVQVRFPRNVSLAYPVDYGQLSLSDAPITKIGEEDFYLLYEDYDTIDETIFSFSVDENGKPISYGQMYVEFIYEKKVPKEEIGKYKLLKNHFTTEDPIMGNWEAIFTLKEESFEEETVNCNVTVGDFHAKRLSLTPFRITVFGKGTVLQEEELVLFVTMKDGEVKELVQDKVISGAETQVQFRPEEPVEPENIAGIILDGQAIDWK